MPFHTNRLVCGNHMCLTVSIKISSNKGLEIVLCQGHLATPEKYTDKYYNSHLDSHLLYICFFFNLDTASKTKDN